MTPTEKWNKLKEKLIAAKDTAKFDKDINQVRTLEWVISEMNKLDK